jgi:hypothetical protein
MGGLCNQLFQAAYGAGLEARGYDVAFDQTALGRFRKYELGEYGVRRFHHYGTEPHEFENSLVFDAKNLSPTDPSVRIGYWQNEKYFENVATSIRNNMNRHWMTHPLTGIALEVEQEIYRSVSVFVHVRRQDYLNLQHYHGVLPIEYYRKAHRQICMDVFQPKTFVFSDDPDWCYENFPKDFKIVRGTTNHEDLRLMASCKHAIIANSSFSWWSSWLGDNQLGRVVIAPKKWFTADIPNEIVPDRWLKI